MTVDLWDGWPTKREEPEVGDCRECGARRGERCSQACLENMEGSARRRPAFPRLLSQDELNAAMGIA